MLSGVSVSANTLVEVKAPELGNLFPQLAISEYKVITSNYKAEHRLLLPHHRPQRLDV